MVSRSTSRKTKFCVIDFQALYNGRVRVGFDIGGTVYEVHHFYAREHHRLSLHSVRKSADTLRHDLHRCLDYDDALHVRKRGERGRPGPGDMAGIGFFFKGSATAGNGAQTHMLSVRPKPTFNAITNRARFDLEMHQF